MSAGGQQLPIVAYRRRAQQRATAGEVICGAVMIVTGAVPALMVVGVVVALADGALRDVGMVAAVPALVGALIFAGLSLFCFRFGYEMLRGSVK